MDLKSRVVERLTDSPAIDTSPSYSPDGKKITFSSNRDAENPRNTNIFIADVVHK